MLHYWHFLDLIVLCKMKIISLFTSLLRSNITYFKSQAKSCTPAYVVLDLNQWQMSIGFQYFVCSRWLFGVWWRAFKIYVGFMSLQHVMIFFSFNVFSHVYTVEIKFFKVMMSLACHILRPEEKNCNQLLLFFCVISYFFWVKKHSTI